MFFPHFFPFLFFCNHFIIFFVILLMMLRSLLSRWINQCWYHYYILFLFCLSKSDETNKLILYFYFAANYRPFTYLKNGSMVSLSCHKIPQPKSGTVLQPCLLGYPPQLRRLSILAAISQYNSATSNASTVSRPFTLPEK